MWWLLITSVQCTAILSKNRFALLFLHTKLYNFGKQSMHKKKNGAFPMTKRIWFSKTVNKLETTLPQIRSAVA